jgi:hypothetical protein
LHEVRSTKILVLKGPPILPHPGFDFVSAFLDTGARLGIRIIGPFAGPEPRHDRRHGPLFMKRLP